MSSKTLFSIGAVMVVLPIYWRISSPATGSATSMFDLLASALGVAILVVGYMRARKEREQTTRDHEEIDMSKLR